MVMGDIDSRNTWKENIIVDYYMRSLTGADALDPLNIFERSLLLIRSCKV